MKKEIHSKDTSQTPFRVIPVCLQEFKPQLLCLRQCPDSGTMIECCFYSRDTLMLVPQSEMFIQEALFMAFLL